MIEPNDQREHQRLILAVARWRDANAFDSLYRYYAPRLTASLRHVGINPSTAEDIAQETMLRVWHSAYQFIPGRANVSTWIYTIARNVRIDILRHERHASDYERQLTDGQRPVDGPDIPDADLITAELRDRLTSAISLLPSAQLHVIMSTFYEGASQIQVASDTDTPPGTIKGRIRLALAKLRETVGAYR